MLPRKPERARFALALALAAHHDEISAATNARHELVPYGICCISPAPSRSAVLANSAISAISAWTHAMRPMRTLVP